MSELASFIAGMPKAELHLHIEGTLEPELKFELAARNGLELPYSSADAMRAAYDFNDLPSFLAVYYEGMAVLLHEPDFFDLWLQPGFAIDGYGREIIVLEPTRIDASLFDPFANLLHREVWVGYGGLGFTF